MGKFYVKKVAILPFFLRLQSYTFPRIFASEIYTFPRFFLGGSYTFPRFLAVWCGDVSAVFGF